MIKNTITKLFFNEGCLLDGEKKLLYDCDKDIVLKYSNIMSYNFKKF